MAFSFPNASIVVPTYNNAATLEKVLQAMLSLDYPGEYEIIVVNDGSSDRTRQMLEERFGKEKRIRAINFEKNQGVCRARNAGIGKARFPIVVNMDHDCIPEKGWLKKLVKGFRDKKVGVVSSFGAFGGTSTAFRKSLVEKAGGYDEEYRYYREDTDLTFKIMEMGYSYKHVKASYLHDHREVVPKGFWEKARHVLKRLRYHQNDVLLYKKHPRLASEFLHVKAGFLVSPEADFQAAVNKWQGSDKRLKLGSPRGITFVENKSPFHALLIIFLGLFYVAAVKASRLWGSIRFGKLLL